MNKINIYISGGGDANDSFPLDKHFIDNIKIEKGVLYIPIAMEANSYNFDSCYSWITKTLSKISDEPIDVCMWTDLYNKSWNDIKKFGAIYIGGGNTFKLLNILYNSGFISLLNRYIKNGGVVYGGSAGAIIMGASINTVKEENDNNYKESKGLDLLSGCSLICHYQKKLDKGVLQYIKKNNQGVIALPERTGLVISKSNCLVVGYESAYFFNKKGKLNQLKLNKKYHYDKKSDKFLICD